MADGTVAMDVRALIAVWPLDAPRGAVTRFCREHQISRSWFYELLGRARSGGVSEVIAHSRRPVSSPAATSALLEDLAVRGRKELTEQGWDAGPVSVGHWMVKQGVAPPSRATLARLFARRGLVDPQPQKRPRSSWRRFQFPRAHDCWQLDGTQWHLADASKVTVFEVIDDRSRCILASVVAHGETAQAALEAVMTAAERHRAPLRLLTDNGAALNPTRRGQQGLLETAMRGLGVKPIASTPYHPQTCGKNERVHATLKRWLRAHPDADTISELAALIARFDAGYNNHRPHQALDGLTPAHVLATVEHAPLPVPPEPTAPPAQTSRVTEAKVAPNGNAGIGGKLIQVGHRYAHHTVIGHVDGTTITVYDTHGALIRTITTTHTTRYYGLGRPKRPHCDETSEPSGMS